MEESGALLRDAADLRAQLEAIRAAESPSHMGTLRVLQAKDSTPPSSISPARQSPSSVIDYQSPKNTSPSKIERDVGSDRSSAMKELRDRIQREREVFSFS